MPLNKSIVDLIERAKKNNSSEISLAGKGFVSENDIQELVETLNQCPTIHVVDLSNNNLSGEEISRILSRLQHVKKLTLINSDLNDREAVILCRDGNFEELTLELKKDNLTLIREIQRANPLKVIITSGFSFDRTNDAIIQLVPQPPSSNLTRQKADEKDKRNNSNGSATTAPHSSIESTEAKVDQAPVVHQVVVGQANGAHQNLKMHQLQQDENQRYLLQKGYMPLNEGIKALVNQVAASKQPYIELTGGSFFGNDVGELVELLNQCPTITEVNLSRNNLLGEGYAEALAKLKHVSKLILVRSGIDYNDALILCANENFRELTLDRRDLGDGSFEEHRKIVRRTPLNITIVGPYGSQPETVKLGPQVAVATISEGEVAVKSQTREENNSGDSAATGSTAPISVDSAESGVQASKNSWWCGFCRPKDTGVASQSSKLERR